MWAWVFDAGEQNNHSQQASPAQVAQWCVDHGYAWAALEIDDERFRPQLWWPRFRDECQTRGVLAGTWNTEGGNFFKTPGDADFAICEIEGPGDYEGLVNVLNGVGAGPAPNPAISRAIITNFNFAPAGTQKLLDEGFTCLTEAYLNESPTQTPDNMDKMAKAYGWTASQAVAGVYPVGGNPVPSYAQWENWPLVDYLGEYLI